MENSYLISMFISLVWSYLALHFAKTKGFFSLTHHQADRQKLTIISVLIAFFIFLGTQVAFSAFFPRYQWKDPIAIITCAILLWGFMEFVPGVKKIVWGSKSFVSQRQSLYNFGFGAMTWLIAYPIVMLLNQSVSLFLYIFMGKTPVDQLAVDLMKGYLDNPYHFWIMALIICLVVPTIEEVLFRGFLQNKLKGMIQINYAIGLTSIIFAFFHFAPAQGLHNIGIIAALFILSCFLGYLYERQQSLLAPIGLHCAFNTFSVLLIFYQL